MSFRKARQMELARAHFHALMATGPNSGLATLPRMRNLNRSYKMTLLSNPPWQPRQRSIPPHPQRSTLIQSRVAEIKRRSTPAHPVCLKCGDRGHRAKECRNSLVYFLCNKIGHRGAQCHSVTSPSFHSDYTAHTSETTAMAPPGSRRGVTRPRFQPFGQRPP